jgi:MoxR-like ATPase
MTGIGQFYLSRFRVRGVNLPCMIQNPTAQDRPDSDSLRRPVEPQELSTGFAEQFANRVANVSANIGSVIKGKEAVINLALVCLFAEGHLLLEDVPGTGKTRLAQALAASLDAANQRVQFTPDLLPSDVTGVTIYHQGTAKFEFHPGPVFANVVLADEINRASPRTQAALLEVMEERQVTVDGVGRGVPRPFMVIATQNPIDMDGTYPLPEAQLDRFLMRTSMGYPDHQSEMAILDADSRGGALATLRPVLSLSDAEAMVAAVHRVHASVDVCDYLVRLVAATRSMPELRLPVSPRGTVGLMRAAKARALTLGRAFVTPEDVKSLAASVLSHRIILTPEASMGGLSAAMMIDRVVSGIAVPHANGRS